MIKRIVCMTFQEDKTHEFETIFEKSKEKIRAFRGCKYLSLHKDYHKQNVYYTLSHWDSQQDLDEYRNSQLFRETWAKTKPLFQEKPMAFSLSQIEELR